MFTPTMIIHRLVVVSDKKFVYDEQFFAGVNIIRGVNGTGKSTIIELLVYALGNECKNWNAEQALCNYTLAQISLNGRMFTLKRHIVESGKAPMDIYEGALEQALADDLNWSRYPYSRSADKESYSQKIFDLLGLPQHKTDESQNLTVHQIMRLIYVDQTTPPTLLLNAESQFDKPIVRKAIGEYLLGLDDLCVHSLRQQLQDARKKAECITGELKAIHRVLGASHELELLMMEEGKIRNEIEELKKKRESISTLNFEKLTVLQKEECNKLKVEMEALQQAIVAEGSELQGWRSELEETRLFIKTLEYRRASLSESQIVSEEFDNVSFKYCPLCLAELTEQASIDTCPLCKKEKAHSNRIYSYLQMTDELNFQIQESNKLIKKYNIKIDFLQHSIEEKKVDFERIRLEYTEKLQGTNARESELLQIATAIGFSCADLKRIKEKIELAREIGKLEEAKQSFERTIRSLERQVEEKENERINREEHVFESIEKIARGFLIGDGGYEEAFKNPVEISFDFGKDSMFVNGRSKFSASSMVVMKNAIRAGIFFHSILDEDSRFPRCFIIDNIEDKGMAPDRSQNFQRLLVKKCKEYDDDFYQLIFTTSMIDPELNNSEYVVGPHYDKGMHTLNFGTCL